MPTEITTLVQFFKVLADSTRLRIVGLLAVEERSVEDIATLVDVRAPTVSHHLSKLKKLGLVTVRSEGTTRWYRLDLKNLERLARETLASETFTDIGDEVERGSEAAYARKVKRVFMPDGRITQIPMQHKKREVLTRHIARMFEPGRVYTQREVNEVIKSVAVDHTSFRRYMVASGWMNRDRAGHAYQLAPDQVEALFASEN